jgi:hypothetical protein
MSSFTEEEKKDLLDNGYREFLSNKFSKMLDNGSFIFNRHKDNTYLIVKGSELIKDLDLKDNTTILVKSIKDGIKYANSLEKKILNNNIMENIKMDRTKSFANYLLEAEDVDFDLDVKEKKGEEKEEKEEVEEKEIELDPKKVEKILAKLEKTVAKLDEEHAEKFEAIIAEIKKLLGKEEEE